MCNGANGRKYFQMNHQNKKKWIQEIEKKKTTVNDSCVYDTTELGKSEQEKKNNKKNTQKSSRKTTAQMAKERPHRCAHHRQLKNVTFQLRLGRLKNHKLGTHYGYGYRLHNYIRGPGNINTIEKLKNVERNGTSEGKEKKKNSKQYCSQETPNKTNKGKHTDRYLSQLTQLTQSEHSIRNTYWRWRSSAQDGMHTIGKVGANERKN